MPHVVLLGDSIFDNQSYVQPGGPDVIRQLRARLPADYANPIEPSVHGGDKIAATIAALVTTHDFTHAHTQIYTLPSTSV